MHWTCIVFVLNQLAVSDGTSKSKSLFDNNILWIRQLGYANKQNRLSSFKWSLLKTVLQMLPWSFQNICRPSQQMGDW